MVGQVGIATTKMKSLLNWLIASTLQVVWAVLGILVMSVGTVVESTLPKGSLNGNTGCGDGVTGGCVVGGRIGMPMDTLGTGGAGAGVAIGTGAGIGTGTGGGGVGGAGVGGGGVCIGIGGTGTVVGAGICTDGGGRIGIIIRTVTGLISGIGILH